MAGRDAAPPTSSGGFSVNVCAMQCLSWRSASAGSARAASAATTASMGSAKSTSCGVFVRGENDLIDAFYAPYGDTLAAITDAAFGETT